MGTQAYLTGGQGERPPPQTSLIRAKIMHYSGNVWIFTPGNIQFLSQNLDLLH